MTMIEPTYRTAPEHPTREQVLTMQSDRNTMYNTLCLHDQNAGTAARVHSSSAGWMAELVAAELAEYHEYCAEVRLAQIRYRQGRML